MGLPVRHQRVRVIDYFYTYKGQLAEDGVIDDVTDLIERDKAEINPADSSSRPSMTSTRCTKAAVRPAL